MVAKIFCRSYLSPLLPPTERGDTTSIKAAKIVYIISESIWSNPFKTAYTFKGSYAKECYSWVPKVIFLTFVICTAAKPRWGLPLAAGLLCVKIYHRRSVRIVPSTIHYTFMNNEGFSIHAIGIKAAFNQGALEHFAHCINNQLSKASKTKVKEDFVILSEFEAEWKGEFKKFVKNASKILLSCFQVSEKLIDEKTYYNFNKDSFDLILSLINLDGINEKQLCDEMLTFHSTDKMNDIPECESEIKIFAKALKDNNYNSISKINFTRNFYYFLLKKLHSDIDSDKMVDQVQYGFAFFNPEKRRLHIYKKTLGSSSLPIEYLLFDPKTKNLQLLQANSVEASPGDVVISVSCELIHALNFGFEGFKAHILPELLKRTKLEVILQKKEVARHITKPLNDTLGVTMMVLQKSVEEEL